MLNPNPDALAEPEDGNSCAQGILMRLMEVGRLVSTSAIPLPDSIKLAAWTMGAREGLLEVLAREVAPAWAAHQYHKRCEDLESWFPDIA